MEEKNQNKGFSVEELIKDIHGEDSEFTKEAEKRLSNKSVSRFLFRLRNVWDISEEELAQKTGLSVEEIQRIEYATNDEISVQTLHELGKVYGHFQFRFASKPLSVVERIKLIMRMLNKAHEDLKNLCQDDDLMNLEAAQIMLPNASVIIDTVSSCLESAGKQLGASMKKEELEREELPDEATLKYEEEIEEENNMKCA